MKIKYALSRYVLGGLLFAAGALLSARGIDLFAALLFGILCFFECAILYLEGDHVLSLRMLFSMSWLGGITLTNLKLSALQSTWGARMWLTVGLFYFLFMAGYEVINLLICQRKKAVLLKAGGDAPPEEEKLLPESKTYSPTYGKRIHTAIYVVLGLSLLGLLLEAIKFDFVFPIFAEGKPHAYTEFHISGVHYFVVSVVLVPALSVSYLMKTEVTKKKIAEMLILNLIGMLVPILLLSKFQLALFFAFPIILWARTTKRFSRKKLLLFILGAGLVLAGMFTLMIVLRDYEAGYLENIFKFKNSRIPMAVQYPYIYITNNFENLNILVEKLTRYSYGLRQVYPAVCLTGLKFVPSVQDFFTWEAVPATIEELTTVTILYDAYGDFGLLGAGGFGLLIGAVSAVINELTSRGKGIAGDLIYSQFSVYLGLSFFSVWFSLPATWFYFAMSILIGIYAGFKTKKQRGNEYGT